MKVLFITSLLKGGGAEVFLYELVRGLSRFSDIDIVIISGSPIGISDYNFTNVRIHVIPNSKLYFQEWLLGLSNPLIEKRLKRIIQDEKPDIIHLNNFLGLGPAVIKVLRSASPPVVVTIHDHWPVCPKTTFIYTGRGTIESPCQDIQRCLKDECVRFLRALPHLNHLLIQRFNSFREEVRNFLESSVVVAVSNYVKDLLERYGLSKVRIIYNGRTFKEVDASFESWKNRRYILYPGGSRFEKGYNVVRYLLRNLCNNYEIRKLLSDFTFIIRSDRQDISCPYLKFEIVSFLHDIWSYFIKSYITLIPSICQETLSYTAIEAIAYGSLVLAFKVGGLPEVISDGYFLVETADAVSFYERFIDIVKSDKQYLYKKLMAMREYVIKTFDSEKMIKNYFNLFMKLINE
ncbi:MAG: glycosyltransferase [Candidatus Bathyarchaeia archaeon]